MQQDAETNRLHGILNAWATSVAKKRGIFDVPNGYESVVKPFAPLVHDNYGGLPIAWGFECIAHTSKATGKMYDGAEMECIRQSPHYYGATWGFVLVSLSYSAATRLIGEVLLENRGPRGGFQSITFGSDDEFRTMRTFGSKRLDLRRETPQARVDALVETT